MLLGSILLKLKKKCLNTNNLKLKLAYHFNTLTKSKEIRNFENSNEKLMLLTKAVQTTLKKKN